MSDLFGPVKGLLKIDSVCIDNNVFQLHYKVTVIILVALSLLVTSCQYIGDPIHCTVDDVPLKTMDPYCWKHSTFTIPNHVGGRVGKEVVQPGVTSHVVVEDDLKYHTYYQLICFALLLQAAFFYLPRYIWKMWEGGRISMLVTDIDCPTISEDCKADRKKLIIDFIATNLHTQNFYAIRFFLCEYLNFANVIVQIFFMDYFLEGVFSTYGSKLLRFTEMELGDREDPMARVFPKVTKCTYHKYSLTGVIQKLDGLCVLPHNIVNEKIYVFLWFWFWFVAVLSGLNLVFRIIVMVMPKFRLMLLRARSRLATWDEIETIAKKCRIGDWFILYQLGKNIDPLIFNELISDLAKRLEGNQSV